MMLSYLVDTHWVVDHLGGDQQTTSRLMELEPSGIAISIVSLGELYEGVYYSSNPEQSQEALNSVLAHFRVLPVDNEICRVFGKQRGGCVSREE